MAKHSLPIGTVTFLFTDIEGSTQLWEKYPEEMKSALAKHDSILKKAIEGNHGHVIKTTGDGIHAAFETAIDAVHSTIAAQGNLQSLVLDPSLSVPPPESTSVELQLKIRMGLHTGEAEMRDNDYYGQTLNRAARIMAAGHGGQILLSGVTAREVSEHLPINASLKDLGEHRLKDLIRPERLFQLNAPDLPKDFPPLKSLNILPNNLPLQLTSFIGREREMKEASTLLASTRLLTFIGPGGTGKTRLSLQVAVEQFSHFRDGVWFIELAPLADPMLIPSTIASVFDLRETQNIPLLDTLLDYLRAKQLLIILDNCEHMVEAGAQFASQLLHACPHLKIIASSREALGIDGETVFRVPSLSLPKDLQRLGDFGSLMGYEATRLFIERAEKAEPRFHVTEHNAYSIAQICSRLDGIPLAIELAAARVKLFTPEQIAARLDDRFKLLTGGSRTALPRQQTLRALIDWSYLSLNETEQRAFRQLAVFSGGWTFEAAESVVGEMETMEGLTGLVNKSLVIVEERESESRYRYLETIRQYAMEKLLEASEAMDARNRHLAYFWEYVRDTEEKLHSAQRLAWLNLLEFEHDNLRSALGWALENDPKSALQTVCALSHFWLSRSYLTEGCNWCQAATSRVEALPAREDIKQTRTDAYNALAMLSINRGDHHAGQMAAKQAVALARQSSDTLRLARALNYFGLSSAFSGEIPLAFDSLKESETLCRKFRYKEDLAWVLQSLAYVTMEVYGKDALDQLQTYLEESLALTQGSGHPEASMRTEGILSRLAYFRGNFGDARKHADRMLDLHRELGDKLGITGHQSGMAHAVRQIGNFEEALALYRETIREWQEIGHRGAVAHQLECFAFIAKALEQPERAAKLLGAAEALREVSSSPMTPQERAEFEREVADLRAGMDEASFTSNWAQGRSMTMEQAVEMARTE